MLTTFKANAVIQDSIFATIGSKAITQSDIIKEIKIILILSGQSFTENQREALEATAVQTTIKRTIKKIGVESFPSLGIDQNDVVDQLERLANNKLELHIITPELHNCIFFCTFVAINSSITLDTYLPSVMTRP